jgi:cytochrome c oxidase subunit I+III
MVIAPGWETVEPLTVPFWPGWLASAGAVAGAGLPWMARRTNAAGRAPGFWLIGGALAQAIAAALLVGQLFGVPEPTGHARQATMFVLYAYAALHCGLGSLMTAHGFWRLRQGFVSAQRATEMVLAWLWSGYGAGATVLAVAMATLLGSAS